MPIKFDNKISKSIKVGKDDVVRIYAGQELVYAVLTATFVSFDKRTTEKFVWGVGMDTLPTPTLTDAERLSILTKCQENGLPKKDKITLEFEGWYEDKELTMKVDSISKYQEEDITLYANWIISAKQYKAYYHYYITVEYWSAYEYPAGEYGEGGGEGVAPAGEYWTWYLGNPNYKQEDPEHTILAGQCTWYANGRSREITGSSAPKGTSGYGDAGTWYTNCGGGWTPTRDYSSVRPGDIVVYENHVMVVEENYGGGNMLVSHFNNTTNRVYDASGRLISYDYTLTSNGYSDYKHGTYNWWGCGDFKGYLHYTG